MSKLAHLFNSGTSDGARKGWEYRRRSGLLGIFSPDDPGADARRVDIGDYADSRSKLAEREKTSLFHVSASKAHAAAAAKFRRMAEQDDGGKNHFARMAELHRKKMEEHARLGNNCKSVVKDRFGNDCGDEKTALKRSRDAVAFSRRIDKKSPHHHFKGFLDHSGVAEVLNAHAKKAPPGKKRAQLKNLFKLHTHAASWHAKQQGNITGSL
jgi:hypothetical protein